MMNQYNRQNPFMYLMETKEQSSVQKTNEMIKRMIKTDIVGFFDILASIGLIIIRGYHGIYSFMIIIVSFFMAFCLLQIRSVIRTLNIKETNEMIFGNSYENIDLNNEKLLVKINKIHIQLGRLEFVDEFITFMCFVYLFLLGYSCCEIVSLIFI